MTESVNYENKNILAPMVRIGRLPARLLCLDYGADLVYSEEIIDFKLLRCNRVVNDTLGTVDMIWSDGTVVFRTCPKERKRVILQIGTSDAQRALKAAKMLENDIAAVDVNMGCPKEFSIKGGMGAALLTQPEKIKEILTTLVNGLSIPVTCKIRILPELEDTIALVKLIESTGVAAIAVHGRTRDERPRHQNHDEFIKAVTAQVKLPVIANGGSGVIKCFDDIAKFRESTGCKSVMLARAAEWNFSIFRKDGLLPVEEVIKDYLKYAIEYEGCWINAKYTIQQIMHELLETPKGKAVTNSGNLRDICAIWGMEDHLCKIEAAQKEKITKLRHIALGSGEYGGEKRRKLEDGTVIIERAVHFIRKEYSKTVTPKNILYDLAKRKEIDPPSYDTVHKAEEKLYYSVVTFDNMKYATTLGEKCKRFAEQASASVCLRSLGLSDGRMQNDSTVFTEKDKNSASDPKQNTDHKKSVNGTAACSNTDEKLNVLKENSDKDSNNQNNMNSRMSNLKTADKQENSMQIEMSDR